MVQTNCVTKNVVVILGPTAVGKSDLALKLAKQLDGEIISADSMQVYRGLDVGTAKATKEEMAGIPHHLIDIKDFDGTYNAFEFVNDARQKIDEIIDKSKTPIIVGGTNLYISALVKNYDFAKSNINETPYQLNNNVKYHLFALNFNNRETLYERINKRVDLMLKNGLFEEVQKLKQQGLQKTSQAGKSIGYFELLEHFDGNMTFDEAINKIKQHSRNFAKRQLTWLRSMKDELIWLDASKTKEENLKIIKDQLKN